MLQDLNRQVVKSEKAVFSIPHLKFEQPASKGGKKPITVTSFIKTRLCH